MSKGVILTAGGNTYFPNAYGLVCLLRHYGCELPIEWFYIGQEMKPEWITYAEKVKDVKCIDLSDDMNLIGISLEKAKGGWQSKTYAMLKTSFDEFLYLDADCFPMKDPAYLFDTPQYKEFGAIFLPDIGRWDKERFEVLEERFGVPYENIHEFEGGAMLINKVKCREALEESHRINNDPDTYKVLFGDKDTFYFGWRRTNTPYFQTQPCICKSNHLVQFDPYGFPLYRHLTQAKFDMDGVTQLSQDEFPTRLVVYNAIQNLNKDLSFDAVEVTNDDILFMVQNFYKDKDRIKAVKETWGKSIPDLYVSVRTLPYYDKQEEEWYMWRDVLKYYPNKKWFIRIDDDTYFFTDKIAKVLSKYNPTIPFYGGDFDQWRSVYKDTKNWWISGGSGLVLSRSAVEKMVKKYDRAYPKFGLTDLLVANYMNWLHVSPTNIKGMHQIITKNTFKDPDLISVHQVSPNMMYEIHSGKRDIEKTDGQMVRYEGMYYGSEKIIDGWCNFQDIYSNALQMFDNTTFVEIGSYQGKSSVFMAKGLVSTGKKIKFYCVDNWVNEFAPSYPIFLENIKPYSEYINVIKKPSLEAVKDFAVNSIDFCFIDAQHDYANVKADILAWFPKMKKGGFICGHDYIPKFKGVMQAVDELFPKRKIMGTSWVVQV